jgi:hypothetical protein
VRVRTCVWHVCVTRACAAYAHYAAGGAQVRVALAERYEAGFRPLLSKVRVGVRTAPNRHTYSHAEACAHTQRAHTCTHACTHSEGQRESSACAFFASFWCRSLCARAAVRCRPKRSMRRSCSAVWTCRHAATRACVRAGVRAAGCIHSGWAPRAQAQLQAREAEIAALTAEARRAGGGGGGGGGAGEDGASRLPRAHACAAAIPA